MGHDTETVDTNCSFHCMTAVMLLWVKFQGSLCTKREKPPQTVVLLLSMVPIAFEVQRRHESLSSEILMLEAKEQSGTLSLLPPHFPWAGTAQFLTTIPHFPHSHLQPTASLLWQPSEVILKKGEELKAEHAFSPPLPAAGLKRLWKKQHSSSGVFASIQHKTGQPKNKLTQCNS